MNDRFEDNPIIAALRTNDDITEFLKSPIEVAFLLSCDILTISPLVKKLHDNGKEVYVHIDLMNGIGKDSEGVRFLKKAGVDGIITTRTNIIKYAKQSNLKNVLRFFIVDSHSVDTATSAIASCAPDMIEIMPGILFDIIKRMKNKVSAPIIAGGLIESKQHILSAMNSGAAAVSTGKIMLWYE